MTRNSRCLNFSSQFARGAKCSFNIKTQTVTAINIFPDSSYSDTDVPLSFKVSAIRNPRSIRPSEYFTIMTTDSEGYAIEGSDNSAFVEMTQAHPLNFGGVSIDESNSVVGTPT